MVGRWFRIAVVLVVVALAGLPAVAAAQTGGFPSQQGGGQSGGGNFPSQGGGGGIQGQSGRGGVFESQQFGFVFEWGPEWELTGEVNESGFDAVGVTNGVSNLVIMAFNPGGDSPQTVVENIAAGTEIADLQFAEVVFDEPDRAAAYYVSQAEGVGYFIDAIARDPSTTLGVVWRFPLDQYEQEFEAFVAVMEGFQF